MDGRRRPYVDTRSIQMAPGLPNQRPTGWSGTVRPLVLPRVPGGGDVLHTSGLSLGRVGEREEGPVHRRGSVSMANGWPWSMVLF